MKRQKYTDLQAQLESVTKQETLYAIGLQCAINGEFDYISPWVKEEKGEGSYKYRLARSWSASGGYLLITFRHPSNQRDSTRVVYYEDFFRDGWATFAEPKQIAELEKLRTAYNCKVAA